MRKQFRNQWSGGGFGIAGALKGAAMAGVLNLGSGAVHSVANAIGNAQSNSKAKAKKMELIRNIIKDTPRKFESLTTHLITNVKLHIKAIYPKAIWEQNERVEKRSYQVFQENKEIHESECAWNFLMSNPYKADYYVEIFERYADMGIKQELERISKIFKINEVSHVLDSYINQKISLNFEKISVEAISDIRKWIGTKYGETNDNRIQGELAEVLYQQLRSLKGSKLEDFVNCLIAYGDRENDYILASQYDTWVKDITKDVEICLDSKVDILDIPALEERIDNLLILKRIAQATTKKQIGTVVVKFVKIELTCISTEVNVNDLESIKQNWEKIQRVQSKYGVEDFEVFERIIKQKLHNRIENSKGKKEVFKLQEEIDKIEVDTQLDLSNEKKEINRLLEKIFLEERTVYDYFLDYSKELKSKKPDIKSQKVGQVFDTEEKAKVVRFKVRKIVEIYEKYDYFSYDSVKISISQIEMIYHETGFGKAVLEDLKKQLEKLDIERRTVLGITYNTFEEAESERKKVVGDKKFESEEAAKQEIERQRKEKEMEEYEQQQIDSLEAQKYSNARLLFEIKSQNFITKSSKEKEQYYEKEVLQEYSTLRNVPAKIRTQQLKKLICTVIGVLAIIIAIRPFLIVGWIPKIIIVIIVGIPWAIRNDAKEEIEFQKEQNKRLKEIKNFFSIDGQKVSLKDSVKRKENQFSTNNDNKTSKMVTNNNQDLMKKDGDVQTPAAEDSTLVKVKVIEKYKDSEQGMLLPVGMEFEVSKERAQKLVGAKVVEIIQ